MRTWPKKVPVLSHRPFEGQGVSVYVGLTLPLQYRKFKLLGMRPCLLQGASFPVGSEHVEKTNRAASVSGTQNDDLEIDIADSLWPHATDPFYVDVRHYRDDVEWDGQHPLLVHTDGTEEFLGDAVLLSVDQRAGGVLRVTFYYAASLRGPQPEQFTLTCTDGPTSPSDVTIAVQPGVTGQYTIETEGLDDSGTYDFVLKAQSVDPESEEGALLIDQTILEISALQPDETGPPSVGNVSIGTV